MYIYTILIIYISGTKAFSCDICKRKFSLKDALVSHRKTHTCSTQFACYLCSQRFREKRYLQRHLGTHTSNKYIILIIHTSMRTSITHNIIFYRKKYFELPNMYEGVHTQR